MLESDSLKITILRDGTIKTVTDVVSPANHDNAEQFLRGIETLAGGESTREQRGEHPHEHHHEHGTEHTH